MQMWAKAKSRRKSKAMNAGPPANTLYTLLSFQLCTQGKQVADFGPPKDTKTSRRKSFREPKVKVDDDYGSRVEHWSPVCCCCCCSAVNLGACSTPSVGRRLSIQNGASTPNTKSPPFRRSTVKPTYTQHTLRYMLYT